MYSVVVSLWNYLSSWQVATGVLDDDSVAMCVKETLMEQSVHVIYSNVQVMELTAGEIEHIASSWMQFFETNWISYIYYKTYRIEYYMFGHFKTIQMKRLSIN